MVSSISGKQSNQLSQEGGWSDWVESLELASPWKMQALKQRGKETGAQLREAIKHTCWQTETTQVELCGLPWTMLALQKQEKYDGKQTGEHLRKTIENTSEIRCFGNMFRCKVQKRTNYFGNFYKLARKFHKNSKVTQLFD